VEGRGERQNDVVSASQATISGVCILSNRDQTAPSDDDPLVYTFALPSRRHAKLGLHLSPDHDQPHTWSRAVSALAGRFSCHPTSSLSPAMSLNVWLQPSAHYRDF
jgi:hypothetical protein